MSLKAAWETELFGETLAFLASFSAILKSIMKSISFRYESHILTLPRLLLSTRFPLFVSLPAPTFPTFPRRRHRRRRRRRRRRRHRRAPSKAEKEVTVMMKKTSKKEEKEKRVKQKRYWKIKLRKACLSYLCRKQHFDQNSKSIDYKAMQG